MDEVESCLFCVFCEVIPCGGDDGVYLDCIGEGLQIPAMTTVVAIRVFNPYVSPKMVMGVLQKFCPKMAEKKAVIQMTGMPSSTALTFPRIMSPLEKYWHQAEM